MALFDPGLQPERTELAWRRTALAIGVGSLVTLRLLPAVFGNALWTLAGVAGLLVAVTLWGVAHRRHRTVLAALATRPVGAILPGAGLLLALAVFVTAVGVLGIAVVLAARASG